MSRPARFIARNWFRGLHEIVPVLLVSSLTAVVLFMCWEVVLRSLSPPDDLLLHLHLTRSVTTSVIVGIAVAWMLMRRSSIVDRLDDPAVEHDATESRDTPALLLTIMENTPTGLIVLGEDFRVRQANRTAERVHGGPLVGKKCFEVFNQGRECPRCPLKESQCSALRPVRFDHTDQQTGQIVEVEPHPVMLPDGTRGAVVLERVVTEERRAMAALSHGEQRYRALYEHTPMMYFTLDTQGRVLSVNDRGVRELGYREDELVGRSALAIFHEEDREAVAERFERFLSSGEDVGRWEARKRRKDGSVLSVNETISVIRGVDGETIVLMICEDITGRKRAEDRLRNYRNALRAATFDVAVAEERERRRIAIGLHDQVGQALALAKIKLQQVEQANGNGRKANGIQHVQELLDGTISSCRSLSFDLSSPLLYELGLEVALQSLGQQFEESSGIAFRFKADDKPRQVPEELAIILHRSARELLRNAARHSKATTARMSLATVADAIRLEIADDGVGIHASPPKPSRNGGLGIFSISEQLKNVGGNIEISRTVPTGTRVVITAPLDGAPLRVSSAGHRTGSGSQDYE